MEATRNQTILFKEKCDFSHSTLESVECNMIDLLKAGEGESKCGLDSASMSLDMTRAYLSHSMNGTKA